MDVIRGRALHPLQIKRVVHPQQRDRHIGKEVGPRRQTDHPFNDLVHARESAAPGERFDRVSLHDAILA